VRPGPVVVLGVGMQDSCRWRLPKISTWSRHSRRTVPTHRSANASPSVSGRLHDAEALGPKDLVERSGELGVSIPEQDVPVPQLLRDLQVPSLPTDPGGVGPARRTDDVDSPRGDLDEEQDVRVFRNTISIVKTSQAGTPLPVLTETRSRSGPVRRGARPRPARRGTLRTVLAPTRMPSLRSSPWRRSVATC
jgi:hypothetical protein